MRLYSDVYERYTYLHCRYTMITPVFIGGCPRSGTTLLGSLLGNAPGAVVTPESQFKWELYQAMACGQIASHSASGWKFLENSWRFKIWNCDWVHETSSNNLSSPALMSRRLLEEAVRAYARRVQGTTRPKYWIDHTPGNVKYAHILHGIFPDAHFIHIVRDGRAVMNSVRSLDWGPNSPLAGAAWWVYEVAQAMAGEEYLVKRDVSVHRVSFEELLINPRRTAGGLVREITGKQEVGSVVRCTFQVPSYTEAQHALVAFAPDPSRAHAWREQLTPREIAHFEYKAGNFLIHLGYPLRSGNQHIPSRWERAWDFIRDRTIRVMKRRGRMRRRALVTNERAAK